MYNEIPHDELPAVPTWQPSGLSGKLKWKKFLERNNKKHKPFIHPIFRPYANLYPIMGNVVNLDDYYDCTKNLRALSRCFNESFDSPYFMPVTRDISGQKLAVIRAWLDNPIYCDVFTDELSTLGGFDGIIDNIAMLREYLQFAIELELSTIPPYLSALYSMNPNNEKNKYICELIRSIVHDEMRHLALASNLLLSIGGHPRIAYKDVVKRCSFPRNGLINSKLVNVLPDALLELRAMNLENTIELFMEIEAPCKFEILLTEEDLKKRLKIDSDAAFNATKDEKLKTFSTQKELNKNINKQSFHVHFKHSKRKGKKKGMEKKENKNNDDDDFDGDGGIVVTGASDHGIGAFYSLIRKGFSFLSRKIGESNLFLSKDVCVAQQLGPQEMEGVNYVYNLSSAISAIRTIVDEGEGTSLIDVWRNGDQLSHFHKFLEIKMQHPILEANRIESDGEYAYEYLFAESVKIDFDDSKNGVADNKTAWNWLKMPKKDKNKNVVENPTINHKNAKDIRVIRFNETYGKLLVGLQTIIGGRDINLYKGGTGNSEKHKLFSQTVGVMRQLQVDFQQCLRPDYTLSKDKKDKKDKNDKNDNSTSIAPNWIPPDHLLLD